MQVQIHDLPGCSTVEKYLGVTGDHQLNRSLVAKQPAAPWVVLTGESLVNRGERSFLSNQHWVRAQARRYFTAMRAAVVKK